MSAHWPKTKKILWGTCVLPHRTSQLAGHSQTRRAPRQGTHGTFCRKPAPEQDTRSTAKFFRFTACHLLQRPPEKHTLPVQGNEVFLTGRYCWDSEFWSLLQKSRHFGEEYVSLVCRPFCPSTLNSAHWALSLPSRGSRQWRAPSARKPCPDCSLELGHVENLWWASVPA